MYVHPRLTLGSGQADSKGSEMATMTGDVMPKKYFSIDVECVATGIRHDARSVALVAVVDKHEKQIFKKKVKVHKHIVSYLTPLTGIHPGDLDNGEDLADVIRDVKTILSSDAVIVGQSIESDIKWLELKEGIDFSFAVDLGKFFKTYNPRFRSYTYFSLRHEATTLLGKSTVNSTLIHMTSMI